MWKIFSWNFRNQIVIKTFSRFWVSTKGQKVVQYPQNKSTAPWNSFNFLALNYVFGFWGEWTILFGLMTWHKCEAQPSRSSNTKFLCIFWGCLTVTIVDFYLVAKWKWQRCSVDAARINNAMGKKFQFSWSDLCFSRVSDSGVFASFGGLVLRRDFFFPVFIILCCSLRVRI